MSSVFRTKRALFDDSSFAPDTLANSGTKTTGFVKGSDRDLGYHDFVRASDSFIRETPTKVTTIGTTQSTVQKLEGVFGSIDLDDLNESLNSFDFSEKTASTIDLLLKHGFERHFASDFCFKLLRHQFEKCYLDIFKKDESIDLVFKRVTKEGLQLTRFFYQVDSKDGKLEPLPEIEKLECLLRDFLQNVLQKRRAAYPEVFLLLIKILINSKNTVLAFRLAMHLCSDDTKVPHEVFLDPNTTQAYELLIKETKKKAILSTEDLGDWFFNYHTWLKYWVKLVGVYQNLLKTVEKICGSEQTELLPNLQSIKDSFLQILQFSYTPTESYVRSLFLSPNLRENHNYTVANYMAISICNTSPRSPCIELFLIWFQVYQYLRSSREESACAESSQIPMVQGVEADVDLHSRLLLCNPFAVPDIFQSCVDESFKGDTSGMFKPEKIEAFKKMLYVKLSEYAIPKSPDPLCVAFESGFKDRVGCLTDEFVQLELLGFPQHEPF